MSVEAKLSEVADGVFAYEQRGGWGYSNAGLLAAPEGRSLLIDTLYDRPLTEQMLTTMRAATPAAARIGAIFNTHANGDHCYGNALVGAPRIIASAATAAEMQELPPAAMAALAANAPELGALGEFFMHCFGDFEFEGLELALPDETFEGELALDVADRRVELIEVGPAHTKGDTVAWLPGERVLFTGDVLFSAAHPIAWAGPVSGWIATLERLTALSPAVVVPGHGPLADASALHAERDYFSYVFEHAARLHAEGASVERAAQEISAAGWTDWRESERLVVNCACVYRELDGAATAAEPLGAFTQMAEFWSARR